MRLIDADAAIDAVMDEFKRVPTNAIRAKTRIEKLPSVQPERTWEEISMLINIAAWALIIGALLFVRSGNE